MTTKKATEVLKECIKEARQVIQAEDLRDYQTNIVRIALALFHDKRRQQMETD